MSMSAAETVELLEENRSIGEPVEDRNPHTHRKSLSRGALVWRRLRGKTRFWIGGVAIVIIVLWAFVGPLISPWSVEYEDSNYFNYPPTILHWFGTDQLGHDLLTQTMIGLQRSLVIGFIAGPLSTVLAAIVGSIAGYVGGKTQAGTPALVNL